MRSCVHCSPRGYISYIHFCCRWSAWDRFYSSIEWDSNYFIITMMQFRLDIKNNKSSYYNEGRIPGFHLRSKFWQDFCIIPRYTFKSFEEAIKKWLKAVNAYSLCKLASTEIFDKSCDCSFDRSTVVRKSDQFKYQTTV